MFAILGAATGTLLGIASASALIHHADTVSRSATLIWSIRIAPVLVFLFYKIVRAAMIPNEVIYIADLIRRNLFGSATCALFGIALASALVHHADTVSRLAAVIWGSLGSVPGLTSLDEIFKDWRFYSSVAFIGGAAGLLIFVILLRFEDRSRHTVGAMAHVLLMYKFGVLDLEGEINKIRRRIRFALVLTLAFAACAVVPAFAIARSWAMPPWLYAGACFIGFLCLACGWLGAGSAATYVVRRPVDPEKLRGTSKEGDWY